jgi:inhibitor of KinA
MSQTENYTIFPLGDQAVTISFGNSISEVQNNKVLSLKHWIDSHPFAGLQDIVVAYSSLTVLYDLFEIKSHTKSTAFDYVKSMLESALAHAPDILATATREIRVPVCYDDEFGPDLISISDASKLTREEVIEIHAGKKYKVYMVGFLPGFAYMATVDERIAIARKQKPRTNVQEGSVGIAGIQTGIYPLSSPGGWQIIGRTPLKIFKPGDENPVMFEPGDSVEFYPITKKDFNSMAEQSRS